MLYTEIKVMRGPNLWAAKVHNILAIRFDIKMLEMADLTYYNNVVQYFKNKEYYDPAQNDKKIFLISMIAGLVAELQGDNLFVDVQFPATDICYGIVEYKVEEAGRLAIEQAEKIVAGLLENTVPASFDVVRQQVAELSRIAGEGPTTSIIIEAARQRGIPVTKGPAGYTIFGYGKLQQRLSAALSHNTSCIAVNIAGNKLQTKRFLQNSYIPVPKGIVVKEESELQHAAKTLGYPLVAKPLNGNQGKHVTMEIQEYEDLVKGFMHAKEYSKSVLIEKQIAGQDFRILVVGNKFTAASLRLPACITGDGYSTITKLIDLTNKDPRRGNGHENILTKIRLDDATVNYLKKQGLSPDSVIDKGERVFVKTTANLSTGGTAHDVTDIVHPSTIKLAEKVSKIIGLDICGIDILTADISLPLKENGGAFIEVNAAPGLRMHEFPCDGVSRKVGAPVIELMFPHNNQGRIPIIAITGTNGKTTTTRLMAHMLSCSGKVVGATTTDGIYIDGEEIYRGDCAGPQSARTVLQDPTVECAVLECARGGIIRSGLAFDQCDIAIVTNVAADHLGLKDVHTVEDLARVKAVVPASVKPEGWAILNAANDYAYAMKDKVQCNVALFSIASDNPHLIRHIAQKGTAAYVDEFQNIYLSIAGNDSYVINAADIPLTRNGKAGFMIENVLPVVISSYYSGITIGDIATYLKNFLPDSNQTPGRINEFSINGVNVIVDYAHNPHGLTALAGYLKNLEGQKLGIITGTGDRRDEDIIEFGRIAARMYDDIIIRFDRDTRGRSHISIIELLHKGMQEVNPHLPYTVIPDTKAALEHAIATVPKNSFVVVCADDALHTVRLTREIAKDYDSRT